MLTVTALVSAGLGAVLAVSGSGDPAAPVASGHRAGISKAAPKVAVLIRTAHVDGEADGWASAVERYPTVVVRKSVVKKHIEHYCDGIPGCLDPTPRVDVPSQTYPEPPPGYYGDGGGNALPPYDVPCSDGTISHSGGHSGACSWHGGIG